MPQLSFVLNLLSLNISALKLRAAHLQSVEPASIQEDWEADKVAVFCYNIWKQTKQLVSVWRDGLLFSFSFDIMTLQLPEAALAVIPLTLSSEQNSLQSSLRCSTIFVPCWTPVASAISKAPELRETMTEQSVFVIQISLMYIYTLCSTVE